MRRDVLVIEGGAKHIEECLAIAGELPAHFTAAGLSQMTADLRRDRLYVWIDAEAVAGFAAVRRTGSAGAEITWMAVAPARQRSGGGAALVEHIALDLRRDGVRCLQVRTLAATVDYPPYEGTRRFYARVGFRLREVIDPYTEWSEGNPCAVFEMAL